MATKKAAWLAAGIIIFAGTALAQAKNKELNDAFNAGMAALNAKQFDRAVESFNKALSLADTPSSQKGVLANLAEAYSQLSRTKAGPDRDAALNSAFKAYQKLIALEPTSPAAHNNYALALAQARKYYDAQTELKKAADLDTSQAGRYYYNLGAVLLNAGSEAFKKMEELTPDYRVRLALQRAQLCQQVQDGLEQAAELEKAAGLDPSRAGEYYYNLGAVLMNAGNEAFKKVIELAPNYAEAHYGRAACLLSYAVCLSSEMTTTADGRPMAPPGVKEELQKYLELAPNGPHAEAAKVLLASFGR
jgi:tetratricopeptide (TPR) repeat protein